MKLSELNKLIPINKDEIEVDHVQAIEHTFFNKNYCDDYRNASIDFMIKNNIDFHSTTNTSYTTAKRFVKMSCPRCNSGMDISNGGGNSQVETISFTCPKCAAKSSLTFQHQGLSFSFPKNQD